MGHWDLFVDQSKLDHPMLLNTAADSIFAYRSAPGGQVRIFSLLLKTAEGIDINRKINRRADEPDEKRSVNRYTGATQFVHPYKPGNVTVAGHPSEEIDAGTKKSITRQAGLK